MIHEGFVESRSGYSTRVKSIPVDETEQIFKLRQMLEGYAVRRAAALATQEQKEKLHQLACYMSDHTPPTSEIDYHKIANANEQFHRTIYEAARSPRLNAPLSVAIDVGAYSCSTSDGCMRRAV